MNNETVEEKYCGRCNRKLKSEKSRETGFGPVCKKKHDLEKVTVVEEIGENLDKDGGTE
ncbi:DUF6011 domain-containing protein [Solibacillus sp. FSL W8-0474]|uniref:DUF6011 domain-containing protein n=1 Tax=Solibacillus sp. FSL W8-0474 TaxID=2975336 RepID=UPI0030F7FF35